MTSPGTGRRPRQRPERTQHLFPAARRPLPPYASLCVPRQADEASTAAINRLARAAARRMTRAASADRQRQQRAAWRQTADALARHRGRNASQIEDIRKAQAGLRAEQKAGNRAGVQAWLRQLWQLHGH